MKIRLVSIGKTKQPHVKTGVDLYRKRLSHYIPFEYVELPDVKGGGKAEVLREREAQSIMKGLSPQTVLVALDEHGKQFSSVAFAGWIEKQMNRGASDVVFAIGGATGHGRALLDRAELTMSLSKMTFPHDLARLLFLEQLYRAFTIIRHEPYHNE